MAAVLFADGLRLMRDKRYREAREAFRGARRIYEAMYDDRPYPKFGFGPFRTALEYDPQLVHEWNALKLACLTHMGICDALERNHSEALKTFEEVWTLATKKDASGRPAFDEDEEAMITVRKYIASCHAELAQWDRAIAHYEKLVDILKDLMDTGAEDGRRMAKRHLDEVVMYLEGCTAKHAAQQAQSARR